MDIDIYIALVKAHKGAVKDIDTLQVCMYALVITCVCI